MALDIRLLILLLDHEGRDGIFPKRRRLARIMGCSLSTLDRSIRRCKQAGVLQVESGKFDRKANRYFVTWPLSHEQSRNWRP